MALGPFFVTVLKRATWTASVLDGFVFASIAGIVLVHVLPESLAVLGLPTILIGLAGLFLPTVIERAVQFKRVRTHSAIALGLLALMIHTWLDGVALGVAESFGEGSLSLAIVVHRLPVGVGLWWIVRPRWGRRGAWYVLIAMAISTILGFTLAPFFETIVTHTVLVALQTFVAGSLLHVVMHDAFVEAEHHTRIGELIGVLLGLALIVALPLVDPHAHEHTAATSHYADTFLDLLFESAPALVIGYFLAGVMGVMLPHLPVQWMNRGSRFTRAAKGTVIGLPVPVCSCGVVPLYQGLVKSGVSASAGMAFMVATPELGIEALLLSIPLLGTELTIARAVGAAVVALAAGVIAGRFVKPIDATPVDTVAQDLSLSEKFRVAIYKGFGEIVDDTAPWILLGLAIAAFFGPHVTIAWLEALPEGVDVILFALVGIPVYVCASGSTPLAAAMIFAGASPGAAIAFILSGPATNVTTFGVLSQLHGKKVSLIFGAVVFIFAVILGVTVNMLVPNATVSAADLHDHTWTWWQYVGVVILLAAIVSSIFRMGPRGFISVISFDGHGHSHAHDHDDCDDCGHDHHHHDDHSHDHDDHDHHDHDGHDHH